MSERAAGQSSRLRAIAAPVAAAAPVLAILLGLGFWQVERLGWKEAMLARIDARVHAAPQPLPPAAGWPALAAGDYEYTHVSVTGRFMPGVEAPVFRSSGQMADGLSRPGLWILRPFQVAGGGVLLVNRGIVALDRRDDARRMTTTNETTITGLLRAPEQRNLFTPKDNPRKNEWYTRDPLAISAAMGLSDAAPFSLDEDAHAAEPGLPAGGATVFDIPNNHLSYAVTWFGLAATLVGVVGVFCLRRLRGAKA